MLTKTTVSVLQDWVGTCPLKEQGVLVLALRGPDGLRKEHGAKNIVRAMRGCIMVCGATGAPLMPGENVPGEEFMQMYRIGSVDEGPWREAEHAFFADLDTYNVHWLFHLIHAAEILGHRHPDALIATRWHALYRKVCKKLHVTPETFSEMAHRLKAGVRTEE